MSSVPQHQYGTGMEAVEGRSFISSLFDFSFKTFVTPRIGRLLFVLYLVFITLKFISTAILGILSGPFLLIIWPLAAFLAFIELVYARVIVEMLVALFAGLGYLRDIADNVASESEATSDSDTNPS